MIAIYLFYQVEYPCCGSTAGARFAFSGGPAEDNRMGAAVGRCVNVRRGAVMSH